MNPLSHVVSWKYQKYSELFRPIITRNCSEFIYKPSPPPLEGEIPVFTFHPVLPDWFEEKCMHLAENGYNTLSACEFYEALTSKVRPIRKSVVLTFDDGLKHVWTIAYPLLKKYGLKAVCFLIPGCIPDNDYRIRPTLEDYWKGRSSLEEIVSLGRGASALATWPEIKIMHESGIIDFQSHSMYHSLVFVSNRILDFIHPGYNTHYFGNIRVPLYATDGKDVVSREPIMGMPIYSAKPRMTAHKRFFDDEDIRNRCIETVRKEGYENFFSRNNWRSDLIKLISDHRASFRVQENYETPEERDRAIFEELLESRIAIEEKLPGKKVTHLCYPWFEASDVAIRAAKQAGFEAGYLGFRKGKPTNQPGNDPHEIVRLDEIYLQRLPGIGRSKLIDIFIRLYETRKIPKLLEFTKA